MDIKTKRDERSENGLMRDKTVIESSLRIMILVRVFDYVTVINAPISLKFHRIAEQNRRIKEEKNAKKIRKKFIIK